MTVGVIPPTPLLRKGGFFVIPAPIPPFPPRPVIPAKAGIHTPAGRYAGAGFTPGYSITPNPHMATTNAPAGYWNSPALRFGVWIPAFAGMTRWGRG